MFIYLSPFRKITHFGKNVNFLSAFLECTIPIKFFGINTLPEEKEDLCQYTKCLNLLGIVWTLLILRINNDRLLKLKFRGGYW